MEIVQQDAIFRELWIILRLVKWIGMKRWLENEKIKVDFEVRRNGEKLEKMERWFWQRRKLMHTISHRWIIVRVSTCFTANMTFVVSFSLWHQPWSHDPYIFVTSRYVCEYRNEACFFTSHDEWWMEQGIELSI